MPINIRQWLRPKASEYKKKLKTKTQSFFYECGNTGKPATSTSKRQVGFLTLDYLLRRTLSTFVNKTLKWGCRGAVGGAEYWMVKDKP